MIDFNLNDAVTTSAGLTALVTTLLTALAILVPPVRKWFTELEADSQIALRGFVVLVAAILLAVGSCVGWLPALTCDRESLLGFFGRVVLGAIMGLAGSNATFEASRVLRGLNKTQSRSFGVATAGRAKLLS